MAGKKHTVDLTTNVGIFSFPRVFSNTKGSKDDGSDSYDIQFLIPKSDREGCRAIMAAVKEVGVAAYGENWKKTKVPFRDGDKEADNLTTDGTSTNKEKYPERLGHFFFNARSTKPVAVVDRQRVPITNSDDLYGGSKGKVNITVYPYNSNGNVGIGFSLNGVQKIAEGESFGGGRPAVESMFDMLEEDDDLDLDTDDAADETPVETAKPAARKTAAKKTAAKKAEPEPAAEVDEDDDLLPDDDEADAIGDEYDDL